MKLFYTPGACSLSPHIVLCELGLPHELVKVDLATQKTEDGREFASINPKGYIPALLLDNGELLTEGPAIVQYLADLQPAAGLIPDGGLPRARVQEWLTFIGTELHKNFTPLFKPAATADWKATASSNIERHFNYLNDIVAVRSYLSGDNFCVADAYLFTVINWTFFLKMSLARWPALGAYHERVASRSAVQRALLAEGLL